MKFFDYTNCHMCMKCRNDTKIELIKAFQLKYVIGFVIVMFIALNVQGLDMKKLIFFMSIRKIQAWAQLNSNCCSLNLTMNILCTLLTHERLRYKKWTVFEIMLTLNSKRLWHHISNFPIGTFVYVSLNVLLTKNLWHMKHTILS